MSDTAVYALVSYAPFSRAGRYKPGHCDWLAFVFQIGAGERDLERHSIRISHAQVQQAMLAICEALKLEI